MLKDNRMTTSEVAYGVGFKNPSYFHKCFHDYYGYTPGEAKLKDLTHKDKTGVILTTNLDNSSNKNPENSEVSKSLSAKKMFGISSIVILAILILSFYFYTEHNKNITTLELGPKERSIALLPFKNLSDDKTSQYFADGVMEDILNQLSAIKDLKVISRTSMEQYRDTKKNIPKIAKELGVIYIIESSIQKYGDSVRIITQLIDAKSDTHIWSKSFQRDFNNIFALEREIARQIAAELKTTLSPVEIERIERVPTKNMEAYDLYLQGKYSFNSNDNADLVKYIEYLNKSLELDPDFSLAYAALARAKIQRMRAGFITATKEEIDSAKQLALRSIELDDNARAHASLGWLLLWFEWDWAEAEKHFKLAIQINPNYAGGHVYLSEYLYNIQGDFQGARRQVDLALYLSPYSYYPRQVSAYYYFNEGNFIRSIEEAEKAKEINRRNIAAYWRNFHNYLNLGEKDKAYEELIKGWGMNEEDIKYIAPVKKAYRESGIIGIYQWLIASDLENNTLENPYRFAQRYAFIGDKENALKWLEIAYELHDSSLVYIKYSPYFKDLRNDLRFLAILEKMNLGDYN